MRPENAASTFSDQLDSAGFDFDSSDPSVAWETFKRFAEEPVEGVSDGLLWEIGCFDFSGESQFILNLVRQFTFSEDGEYDHMEQLCLKLFCAPSSQLQSAKRSEWSFNHSSIQSFFQFVESLPEFSIPQAGSDYYAELTQESV